MSSNARLPRLQVVVPAAERPWRPRLAQVWSTPVQLWSLLGAVALSSLLVFWSVSSGISDSRQAFRTVGSESVPSINAALDIYFGMADMDADAANYILVSEYPTPNLDPMLAANAYAQRRQEVSDRLVSAAQNIAFGERERIPILRLTSGLQQYDADVNLAESLIDQGDRAGALNAYLYATALMHDPTTGLLHAALNLAGAGHDALTAGYDQAQATQVRDLVLVVLSGLLLLACLGVLQLFLARRMRRALNLPLLGASGLALVLLAGALATLAANDSQLQVAKQSAYDTVYALRQARATAYDANADQSRYLVNPERAQAYQQAFDTKSGGLTATFRSALGSSHFPGEARVAKRVLEDWSAYQADSRTLRRDAGSGNLKEAVRFDTSPTTTDSGGHFSLFDFELQRWIQIHQSAFDQAVATGDGNLSGWQLYPPLAALLVVGLAFAGLRPRIGEYR